MNLYAIETGLFKLDGGAMFGVVPKSLWRTRYEADRNKISTWGMRCLLVEYSDRLVLVDTGIGSKQSEKFFSHYFLHGDATLDKSLGQHGFHRDDITDVFLTHLHFDHCGGAIERNPKSDTYRPAFKNARYWSHEDHWKWATEPNAREKASFLKENILPIQESGQLNFVSSNGNFTEELFPGFKALLVHGHTEAQMIPHISYKGQTIVFMADLLPSHAHVPLPWVMGYDTRPLLTLSEKEKFFKTAVANDYTLMFEHDSVHQCGKLTQTDRGIRFDSGFDLSEFL